MELVIVLTRDFSLNHVFDHSMKVGVADGK
jgi:hypothetical protein